MGRDMSQREFDAACTRHGFSLVGFSVLPGYFDVGHGIHIRAANGGKARRDQLAYLIQQARQTKQQLGIDD